MVAGPAPTVAIAVAIALLLVTEPPAARGRHLRCACTNCPDSLAGVCVTEYQCYTQYIVGVWEPVAYGCLPGRTPLLCERWVHLGNNSGSRPTSSVVCCDTDLCNRRVPPTTAMESPAVVMPTNIPENILSSIIEGIGDSQTNKKSDFSSPFYPLDKPAVLSILFVGLFFLLLVLTFGFYLLHKQSRTVKRIWKNRSPGEMALSLVDRPPNNC